jgi:hypothetical protein
MRDARILLLDKFFKIKLACSLAMASFVVSNFGFVFSSLTTKLAIANEQLSFILKNLSSNMHDASIPLCHREKNRENTVNFRKFINLI